MNKGSLRLRANTKEPFEYKQVIVIRTDLGMSKGKIAVQVAHAAVSAVEQARRHQLTWLRAWLREGQKKVVVKVPGSEELLALFKEAERKQLPAELIRDRGLTEIPPGTTTTLGIGPAPTAEINHLTGTLPLL